MLKINEEQLNGLERDYPGIRKTIAHFEAMEIPNCPHCGSDDAASVQVGAVGRLLAILRATSKATMIANGPRPGEYFCNKCRKCFG